MRVLLLGGTAFVGRHVVETLLARGHEVVLFNRGQTAPGLYPDLERVVGDREHDLARLGTRRFDAVVDTSAYVPHVVVAATAVLEPLAERYLFVSTVSVYPFGASNIDETSPTEPLPDGADPRVASAEHYGPLKALCEIATRERFGPDRTIVVRPGLIVGPYDPTDRYTYWPARIARGGDVVAPVGPAYPAQFIDVRDLAVWCVGLLEARAAGTFNAVPPPGTFTLGDALAACIAVAESDARLHWASDALLEAHRVDPWIELPLWIPESQDFGGFFAIDQTRAHATGLHTRPLLETARDTLAWHATRPADRTWRAGLTPERERTLLAALRATESHERAEPG